MIPFVMHGAGGRMGRSIIALALRVDLEFHKNLRLVGAMEYAASPHIGNEVGESADGGSSKIRVQADMTAALKDARVVIDFSSPKATLSLVEYCADHSIALVVGTTGFSQDEYERLLSYGNRIPVLAAPNMSVGVNLLFYLVAEASRILGENYDIEISETHHRFKKDAPSGTALRLKDIILDSLGRDEKNVVYGRHGADSPRRDAEIAVHTLRGGDVVGEHTAFFFGDGERFELTHRASSRDTFAAGALRAAKFLADAPVGVYTMKDVLQLPV